MAVHVIGMPLVDQLVEALILNVPAARAQLHDGAGGSRPRRGPIPFGTLQMDLFVKLAADTVGLPAANDPNGYARLRSGSEALQVPTFPQDIFLAQDYGGHRLE
jgi:hypothetical protein